MSKDQIITIARLPQDAKTALSYAPNANIRAEIAAELDLLKLPKLTFTGHIAGQGARDWRLQGHLGATVIQPCAITLEPVTTRIEEDATRHYVADWQDPEEPESEMPEDDSVEPIPAVIDLRALVTEVLALALPDFPKAEGVTFDGLDVTAPGSEALTDETSKPFAGLAGLKEKLEKGE